MKPVLKAIALLATALLLASCARTPEPAANTTPAATSPMASQSPSAPATATQTAAPTPTAAPTTPAQSAAPSATAALPTPTATAFPQPLPTQDVTSMLPDPLLWAPKLKMDAKDYPRVDGSTATLPLGIYLRAKITGETLQQSAAGTAFSKTGPAWMALTQRKADLLVVYEAPDEIKKQLGSAKLTIKPIGIDALVFLTNKGNPVKNLTQKQIVDIYTGKITKWSQVGGKDVDIIPYQRVSNSGSQALMLKLVMKGKKIMKATSMLEPGEMEALIDDIASYDNTSNALGYSVYYYVRNMYTLPGIKLLQVDGVEPNSDTIASGKYPYVSPFYAAIRSDEPADSNARKLFDWLTGAEGKRAITDAGYVASK